MSDRVLIPIPGLGVLALTPEAFEAALEAGGSRIASPSSSRPTDEALVDADKAAALLDVTARWLEDGARAGIVPHHRLGRFIRFRVSDVAAHFRIDGAPVPTDSQSFTPKLRLAGQ